MLVVCRGQRLAAQGYAFLPERPRSHDLEHLCRLLQDHLTVCVWRPWPLEAGIPADVQVTRERGALVVSLLAPVSPQVVPGTLPGCDHGAPALGHAADAAQRPGD